MAKDKDEAEVDDVGEATLEREAWLEEQESAVVEETPPPEEVAVDPFAVETDDAGLDEAGRATIEREARLKAQAIAEQQHLHGDVSQVEPKDMADAVADREKVAEEAAESEVPPPEEAAQATTLETPHRAPKSRSTTTLGEVT